MGGYITLAFAEKYPSLLSGFGLIHSTAFADNEEKKKNREKGIALMEEYGPFSFLKNTIPNLFGAKFKALYPEKVNSFIEAAAAFSKESLQQYYRAMMLRPDRTHVLLSNPLPVLFVMGTEDVAAPMEDVLKQVSLPNISYIHVLSHTGHMGMWEATEQMNDYILAFIKS
jgi:pimeloyl-ACP methyl ester carboxylesterase